MSTSVDQRSKGQPNQVSNGPGPKDGEFEYLHGQPHQGGYGSVPMSSPNVSDPYMSSYYAPYMSFPNQAAINEGAWSNGGDPMSFISGYGQVNNEYMQNTSGMFSGFDYGQPGFGWGFPSGDYNAWGSSSGTPAAPAQPGRKADERGYPTEGYYNMGGPGTATDVYGAVNGDVDRDMGVKNVEHGLKGMSVNEKAEHVGSGNEHHGPPSSSSAQSSGQSGPKKMTWANIASQPARPQPQQRVGVKGGIPRAPVMPSRHNMDIGTWDNSKNSGAGVKAPPAGSGPGRGGSGQAWTGSAGRRPAAPGPYAPNSASPSNGASQQQPPPPQMVPQQQQPAGTAPERRSPPANVASVVAHPVLDRLRSANQYNPKDFNLTPRGARFFIIKSYSEDDIHRSIKYSIWCSTEHGNKRVDSAHREREGKGPVYLFFSVNGSGHFCGMAQMMSPLDYHCNSSVWAQDKWKGQFEVKWIYVKDVPNSQLRHIRLENNENKPVTNSRDTQEVPPEKGKQVLRIIHQYRHTTSIFDDFSHYEKRQEEEPVPPKPTKEQQEDRRDDRRGDRDRGDDRRGDDRRRNDRRDDDRRGDRGDNRRGDDRRGDDRRGDDRRGDDRRMNGRNNQN